MGINLLCPSHDITTQAWDPYRLPQAITMSPYSRSAMHSHKVSSKVALVCSCTCMLAWDHPKTKIIGHNRCHHFFSQQAVKSIER
eukprot:1157460-Pelagomonas_calceolata.AAC.11